MSIIYVLIPLSIILVGVAVWALIWAVRSGQFDDLESQGWNVVLDDDSKPPPDDAGPNKEAREKAGGKRGADD